MNEGGVENYIFVVRDGLRLQRDSKNIKENVFLFFKEHFFWVVLIKIKFLLELQVLNILIYVINKVRYNRLTWSHTSFRQY